MIIAGNRRRARKAEAARNGTAASAVAFPVDSSAQLFST